MGLEGKVAALEERDHDDRERIAPIPIAQFDLGEVA